VVFADAGSTDATLAIAEDSGARVVTVQGDAGTRLAAGVATARSAWILALGEDLVLPEGWRTPVEAHLAGGGGKPAFIAAPGRLGLAGRPLAVLASGEAVEAAGGFKPGGDPLKALLGRLKPRAVRLRI
jgi:glycosyltransferase involved in cell wall biosynthesis